MTALRFSTLWGSWHKPSLGWQAGRGILMTGFGARDSLGDMDVLAWREACPKLIAVECKRLRCAKTVAEIGDQLSDFKGESGDHLAKHLDRVRWIDEHIEQVRYTLGLPPEVRGHSVACDQRSRAHAVLDWSADRPQPHRAQGRTRKGLGGDSPERTRQVLTDSPAIAPPRGTREPSASLEPPFPSVSHFAARFRR